MSGKGPLGLTAGIAWDLHRASRAGPSGLTARQTDRLHRLLADAKARSPYYRDRLVGVDGADLSRVAPSTKPDLMADSDRWVADPAIAWEVIQEFVSDPHRVGEPSDGHFADAAGIARAQHPHPRLAAGARLFSALAPMPQLVTELNEFSPSMLAGYPSVLAVLDLLAAGPGHAAQDEGSLPGRRSPSGPQATCASTGCPIPLWTGRLRRHNQIHAAESCAR